MQVDRTQKGRSRLFSFSRFFLALVVATVLGGAATTPAEAGSYWKLTYKRGGYTWSFCSSTVMNIVAHQDDDLIFFGGAQIQDIAAGKCVVTVFLTAGDAGSDASYWLAREGGASAAHQSMARITRNRSTIDGYVTLNGRKIAARQLSENRRVVMLFLRLPDGNITGQGLPFGDDSLMKLYDGTIPSIGTVSDATIDGLADTASYTKATLTNSLVALMKAFNVSTIRTQNYLDAPIDGSSVDHSDHTVTAKFTQAAATAYAASIRKNVSSILVGYRGYDTYLLRQNLTGNLLDLKLAAFDAYARFDHGVCTDSIDCTAYYEDPGSLTGYPRWLRREYPVTTAKTPFDNATVRGFGGKCLEVRNASSADGAVVQMNECTTNKLSQRWVYNTTTKLLVSAQTGKCARASGTGVVVRTCASGEDPQQRWEYNEDSELKSMATSACVNVPSNTPVNNVAVNLVTCKYDVRQWFGYERPANQAVSHKVVSDFGGLCLNMEPGSNPAVTIRTCTSANLAQQWYFTPGKLLRNRQTGLCATAAANSADDGIAMVGKTCTFDDTQKWNFNVYERSIVSVGGGAINDRCLDLRGPSNDQGTQVQTKACVSSGPRPEQLWKIDGNETLPVDAKN